MSSRPPVFPHHPHDQIYRTQLSTPDPVSPPTPWQAQRLLLQNGAVNCAGSSHGPGIEAQFCHFSRGRSPSLHFHMLKGEDTIPTRGGSGIKHSTTTPHPPPVKKDRVRSTSFPQDHIHSHSTTPCFLFPQSEGTLLL